MAGRETDGRGFPRAHERIPVQLVMKDGNKEFQATVYTEDISLTGVFFASTFFLKAGTEMDLEFHMPNDDRVVRVRGMIVREVHVKEDSPSETVSGFAMRFTEYYADAKTILASSFLIAELDEFVKDYLERRTLKPKTEANGLRDVIVAWEVGKMDLSGGELDIMKDRITVAKDGRIRRR